MNERVNETDLLLRLGEDNELVLVLLEALDVGLDGLERGVAATVVDGDTDGDGLLQRGLAEGLLLREESGNGHFGRRDAENIERSKLS